MSYSQCNSSYLGGWQEEGEELGCSSWSQCPKRVQAVVPTTRFASYQIILDTAACLEYWWFASH